MIQEQTRLKVADNSGARSIMCIRVLGTKSKVARVGDTIRASVKEAQPNGLVKKGDVLNAARIAGINAVKQTSSLIPLAHNILIDTVKVDFSLDESECKIYSTVTVKTEGKTGVEIESLVGVQISLMTIYDMCKYLDRRMIIDDVKLMTKTGGKSGDFIREK